jgi:hypothetical protein
MSDYEKLVPEPIRLLVDSVITTARAHLERDGYLAPVAFVGSHSKGRRITACGGLANVPKDESATAIRALAKREDADFVLWVDEAWMKSIQAKSVDEAKKIRAETENVRDMPGRLDVVMFNLQTHVGTFAAHVLREGTPGKYTFGAVKFEMWTYGEGRLMNLLPQRDTKQ